MTNTHKIGRKMNRIIHPKYSQIKTQSTVRSKHTVRQSTQTIPNWGEEQAPNDDDEEEEEKNE